jgi:xylulokinase
MSQSHTGTPGPHILSIDLGTGGPKVALVGAKGEIAASANRAVETHRLGPDGAEQDPEEIWGAIREASREVIGTGGIPVDRIVGVSVDSQFSSIVPVDRDGHPVMNLILWMDTRGAPYARAIHERHADAGLKWLTIHGVLPLPSGNDSLSHILWIQHERPEIYERTYKFVEPMDYVTGRLTGNPTANACTVFMLLLTDNRRLDAVQYDDELVAMSGVDREKLPELVPVSSSEDTIRPDVARELGLSPRTRVFSATNDTQAIAVGAAFHEAEGGINIGTTSQVLAHVRFKETAIQHDVVSTPSPLPGLYLALAENGLGGGTLRHFLGNVAFARDGLADHSTNDLFGRLDHVVREAPAGSGGLLFLPWLTGAHAPSSNPKMRGGFLNLSLDTTRASMLRAILEGVTFNLRWLLGAVEEFAKQDFDHLRFSGGGALSEEWSQIVADVTNRPVQQLEDARHVINRATAFLAFERLGLMQFADIPKLVRVQRTYEPRPDTRETYDRLFEQFLAAFEQNRPIFEALNGTD